MGTIKKRCWACGSLHVIEWGKQGSKQRKVALFYLHAMPLEKDHLIILSGLRSGFCKKSHYRQAFMLWYKPEKLQTLSFLVIGLPEKLRVKQKLPNPFFV